MATRCPPTDAAADVPCNSISKARLAQVAPDDVSANGYRAQFPLRPCAVEEGQRPMRTAGPRVGCGRGASAPKARRAPDGSVAYNAQVHEMAARLKEIDDAPEYTLLRKVHTALRKLAK